MITVGHEPGSPTVDRINGTSTRAAVRDAETAASTALVIDDDRGLTTPLVVVLSTAAVRRATRSSIAACACSGVVGFGVAIGRLSCDQGP